MKGAEMSQQTISHVFFKGGIVPVAEANVNIMSQVLHYGTGVFGGMRAYWNQDHEELYIFRPLDHFERLLQSASLLRMNLGYEPDELLRILVELITHQGFRTNCYIRPLAYVSEETLAVRMHDLETDLAIIVKPEGSYISFDEGAHICFSAWRRIDDNAIPARGKVVGAYVNSMLVKSDAMLAGYDDALLLNNDGHVAEFSAANMMMIRKGVAITPPIHANILEGIVRRSLIRMLREDLQVEVIEREIDHTEVYLADEVFMCGTGAQISPVTRIEHRNIGDGEIGPITRQLRELFMNTVYGREEKYREWVTPVYQKMPVT
jgi:branched-chain amino acid aminotransferase